jgi:hypothetical protein
VGSEDSTIHLLEEAMLLVFHLRLKKKIIGPQGKRRKLMGFRNQESNVSPFCVCYFKPKSEDYIYID